MDFKVVEAKWVKFWEEHPELYRANDNGTKEKKYVLVEFPYPSGSGLHVGHAFSFTGSDVYARFKRMQGYEVMFPMGWDAFGLPTENYAIKAKRKPQEVTKENTNMFKGQMKRLAYSFDWDREINTADPNYYKWTQWIFIQLFKKGLAYKKEMPINWCPSCKIGLANEEVVDGKCERCGSEVERRTISQWVVKITKYADKLIDGLMKTDFIDKVKQAQINWIGKSEGARVNFKIKEKSEVLEVFTTRPDTLYGATFMVIAPEHELALGLSATNEDIRNYLKETRKKSEMERTELNKEKTGVFSGLYAINPVNNKEIPIWISDFVLANYGTGAIMSVPAHDERDYAFAKKFGLEIIKVIEQSLPGSMLVEDCYGGEGISVNSGSINEVNGLNGLVTGAAKEKMITWLIGQGIGEKMASYHLRDWIFSRQHYWGEPIPMVFCPTCAKASAGKENAGWVPVSEIDLPIVLPEVEAYEPTEDGKSPLSKINSFVKCKCPICGGDAQRETDTMPNWAGSDWYYLAYCFANKINKDKTPLIPLDKGGRNSVDLKLASDDAFVDIFSDSLKEIKKWCPVDVYIGGDEHNTLHLLYSRFVYQFLYDLGAVPKEIPEPYYKRISHGVILGSDNQRMSKSKGNVIVPETVADKYGVDVLRLYLMFMGPFESTMAWNENTLMGVKRFLDRFCQFIDKQIELNTDSNYKSLVIINKTILGVSEDLENFGFNTAVAKLMEAVNKADVVGIVELKKLILLLSPFAPYTTEELWHRLTTREDESVHMSHWPIADVQYLIAETIRIPVAINGKVRDELELSNDVLQKTCDVVRAAKDLEKIKQWIGDAKIVKEIYVSGKMVNFVVE